MSGRIKVKLSRERMEEIILQSLKKIPRVFRNKMENIEIVLEDRPSPAVKQSLGLRAGDTLLGLYQGVPRTQRGADYGNVLPDKITLYSDSLTGECEDTESLMQKVQEVLQHEVGHYFGMSEELLEEIANPRPLGLRRRKR
jgi:predicted Zn-dependent protease with MMP-like domain